MRGYRRTASKVATQVAALKAAGVEKVFREVASGAKTDRRQLSKAIATLEAGDVLVVTRLDRLARSTRDLLNTLATITGRKAGFRSLADTWADTTTSHGRLMLPSWEGWRSSSAILSAPGRGKAERGPWRAEKRWAGRRSSLLTNSARPSSAVTGEMNRLPRLAGATTSARRRFRGLHRHHENQTFPLGGFGPAL
jgi:Resolvase, N terminal domain